MLVVWGMSLNEQGVKIVGEVPDGLPGFFIPDFNFEIIKELFPIALTISFIGFMESIAVAKAIQNKHRNYQIVPNQELIALGVANIGGAFFQSFPTTGGFSRTAVNDQSGAQTGMASIISAGLIALSLLFLTPLFYYLPKAILASVIMVAVFGLIDFREAKHLWKTDKKDFALFVITAIGTLVLGIEEGIIIGVVLSILAVTYQISYPHIAELGKLPGTRSYRNVKRFNKLITHSYIFIFRFDAQLYFANVNYFRDYLLEKIQSRKQIEHIVLNASSINSVDSSAIHMLHDLVHTLNEREIQLCIVGVRGPVRDKLYKAGFTSLLGKENFFLTIEDAVNSITGTKVNGHSEYANQIFI